MTLFRQQTDAAYRQLNALREWANTEEGLNLYIDLARSVQGPQSVKQLALVMAAMLAYSRLVPDSLDDLDPPIGSSYLVDLDTHFRGDAIGNRGRVTEHMIFAMIRVLSTFGSRYEESVAFLAAVLDHEPPLLHPLAGLSDQYLSLRIRRHNHETAFKLVMTEVSCLLSESVSPLLCVSPC